MKRQKNQEAGDYFETEEKASLTREATYILGEARMVIPGVQTIFGFQLIATFQPFFTEKLSVVQQYLHLVAVLLVVCSIGCLIAPAAFHRHAEPGVISVNFIRVSGRFLQYGMMSFALSLSLNVYLITEVITKWVSVSICIGVSTFGTLLALWYFVPRRFRRHSSKMAWLTK